MLLVTYVLLVLAIIIAFLIMIPNLVWLRRMLGYMLAADVMASGYVISTYAATGTFSGLTVAILGAVGISLTLRALRWFLGHEEIVVNDTRGLMHISGVVLRHGALKLIGRSPEPLSIEWIRHDPPMFSFLSRVYQGVKAAV